MAFSPARGALLVAALLAAVTGVAGQSMSMSEQYNDGVPASGAVDPTMDYARDAPTRACG